MARGTGSDCTGSAQTRGSSLPVWWDEPSDNRFFSGSKGAEIVDWLARHGVASIGDDLYRFYHATPSTESCAHEGLIRAGSLLETDPKDAAFFAARDRGLDPEADVTVFTVELSPWQIQTGHWAALRDDYQVDAGQLAR